MDERLDIPTLKTMIEADESARFITKDKSATLAEAKLPTERTPNMLKPYTKPFQMRLVFAYKMLFRNAWVTRLARITKTIMRSAHG